MEPVTLILGLGLLYGGYELWDRRDRKEPEKDKAVQELVLGEFVPDGTIVPGTPFYERGHFYRSEEGYYISNLTPPPLDKEHGRAEEVMPESQSVQDCGHPVYVADLTVPRNADGTIQIFRADTGCGN